ncbi:uncharacterized protein LOC144166540 [Haemaphysalis longicornis]
MILHLAMNSGASFTLLIVAMLATLIKAQEDTQPQGKHDKCDRSLRQQQEFKECMGQFFPVIDTVLNATLGWADFSSTAWKICNDTEITTVPPTTVPPVTEKTTQQAGNEGGTTQTQPAEKKPKPEGPTPEDYMERIENCTRLIMQLPLQRSLLSVS